MCPVSYNKYVKKPNLKIDYTQEMVMEVEKCKNDFYYFCTYVKVVHPDLGKVTYKPR